MLYWANTATTYCRHQPLVPTPTHLLLQRFQRRFLSYTDTRGCIVCCLQLLFTQKICYIVKDGNQSLEEEKQNRKKKKAVDGAVERMRVEKKNQLLVCIYFPHFYIAIYLLQLSVALCLLYNLVNHLHLTNCQFQTKSH